LSNQEVKLRFLSACAMRVACSVIVLLGAACNKAREEYLPSVAKPSALSNPTIANRANPALSAMQSDSATMDPKPRPLAAPSRAPEPTEEPVPVCPKLIVDSRKGGSDESRFVVPSDEELRTLESVVGRALRHEPLGSLQSDLAPIGYRITSIPEWPDAVLIHEGERRRGGGGFVVRTTAKGADPASAPWAIQAPHTFYDTGTLPIACALFHQSEDARALFYNTAHRYKASAAAAGVLHPADVAHSERTLFQAATRGLLAAVPKCGVVQVHGFADRIVDFGAVLSSGERLAAQATVLSLKVAFSRLLEVPIAAYPNDTKELGATTNVQGPLVRGAGGRFVHMELSEKTRQRLQGDKAVMTQIALAVASVMRPL
jgi:hypothetical protein